MYKGNCRLLQSVNVHKTSRNNEQVFLLLVTYRKGLGDILYCVFILNFNVKKNF